MTMTLGEEARRLAKQRESHDKAAHEERALAEKRQAMMQHNRFVREVINKLPDQVRHAARNGCISVSLTVSSGYWGESKARGRLVSWVHQQGLVMEEHYKDSTAGMGSGINTVVLCITWPAKSRRT